MTDKKICSHCKREFTRTTNAQKYCSEKCRLNALKERKSIYAKCRFCGKKFRITDLFPYCSSECKAKASSIPKRIRRKKPRLSLDEVARLSREAGLTYGKYVQMHGI